MLRHNAIVTPAVNVGLGPRKEESFPQHPVHFDFFKARTGSTFRTNDINIRRKNEIADVFHGATSLQGLPMGVVVDGCSLTARNDEAQDIASQIMGMLEELTTELEGSALNENDIKSLVKQKYCQLDDSLHCNSIPVYEVTDVSFGALALYKDNKGKLKSISFGTGDTLIVRDDAKSISTVIASKNDMNANGGAGAPLPFPTPYGLRHANQKRIVENLEIDISEVDENNRFIFLTDGAYDHLNCPKQTIIDSHNRGMVRTTYSSGITCGQSVDSIYENADSYVSERNNSENPPNVMGDDTTVAEMVVPGPQKQLQFKEAFYQKSYDELTQTLNAHDIDAETKLKFGNIQNKINDVYHTKVEDIACLTKNLIKINHVIINRADSQAVFDYLSYVKTEVSNRQSFFWKSLGAAMTAAATLLVASAIVGTGIPAAVSYGVAATMAAVGVFTYKHGCNHNKAMVNIMNDLSNNLLSR